MKRSNYAPARFAKTKTDNLTIFMAPRLPYYFTCTLLLHLQLVQIIDDREDAVPHRLLGAAGKIEKRIEFALAPFHRRHDSFWDLAMVLAQRRRRWDRRRFVPATPNRHFGTAVSCARI